MMFLSALENNLRNRASHARMFIIVVITVLLSGLHVVFAEPPDSGIYAELLGKYVKDGQVDYAGLKREEARLDEYLKLLEKTDSKSLSRSDQFAFYINAYNAWTIKLILTAYPGVKSIKDIGSIFRSPWKKKIARLDGQILTLDNIEHDIMRPRFKDPRIHFAVNCASKGCPPLRPEPYRGDMLEAQLDQMTRLFINDPSRNRFEKNTLYVSSIFKWYSEDFGGDTAEFVFKYAEGKLKEKLKGKSVRVEYLDYDWSLNGK